MGVSILQSSPSATPTASRYSPGQCGLSTQAMTDAAAQAFADIFGPEQSIQTDVTHSPLSPRDEEGGEGRDGKGKPPLRKVGRVPRLP